MKRILLWVISLTAAVMLGFAAGHIHTILTLEIETDGDGDSAIVTTVGGWQYLYAINGHTLDQGGEMIHDLGKQP